jgi:hypothetical protein
MQLNSGLLYPRPDGSAIGFPGFPEADRHIYSVSDVPDHGFQYGHSWPPFVESPPLAEPVNSNLCFSGIGLSTASVDVTSM